METKFQTSFIPKKPINPTVTTVHHAGTNIFMVLCVIIFIASLAGAGFAYGYKNILIQKQVDYKKTLEASRKAFNPDLIESLKRVNTKIDLAKLLLANHLAVSEVFDIVGQLTAVNIRFNSFDFSQGDKDGLKVSMHGVGQNYKAIAFQSDVFGMSSKYGRNKVVKTPVVGDLAVDNNGHVAFSFAGLLNPADLSYVKQYEDELKKDQP